MLKICTNILLLSRTQLFCPLLKGVRPSSVSKRPFGPFNKLCNAIPLNVFENGSNRFPPGQKTGVNFDNVVGGLPTPTAVAPILCTPKQLPRATRRFV